MHLNVEIKARCRQTEEIHTLLLEQGADFRGEDHQIDTYFRVPQGRLKLRQGLIENALIHYERPNQAGPKTSEVSLCPAPEGEALKAVLHRALGTLVTVDKRRRIYFIKNVKFHLDQVVGLGSFVEIEAIDSHGDLGETYLRSQCDHYMQLMAVMPEDLLEVSYSDMLLGQQMAE